MENITLRMKKFNDSRPTASFPNGSELAAACNTADDVAVSNAFTCAVFISTRQLREMKMNEFLLSLAVSNLLIAALVVPGYGSLCTGCFLLINDVITRDTCFILDGLKDFGFLANTFNILAVTYDRHFAIMDPLRYQLSMTTRKIAKVLITAWVSPLPLSFMKQIINSSSKRKIFENATHKEIYDISVVILCVFHPMCALTSINVRIAIAIRKQTTRVSVRRLCSNTKTLRRKAERKKEKNGTISCLIIVLIFIGCWIPRSLFNFVKAFEIETGIDIRTLDKISLAFILVQSLANPHVYSFYRSDFRQAAKRVLKTSFCINN